MYTLACSTNSVKNHNTDTLAQLTRSLFDLHNEPAQQKHTLQKSWSPPIDLVEGPDKYQVRIDLPGVSKDELEITLHDDILTLSSSPSEPETDVDEKYLLRERRSTTFSRRIQLPQDVNSEHIDATLTSGVLFLSIAKHPKKMPKKIQIG